MRARQPMKELCMGVRQLLIEDLCVGVRHRLADGRYLFELDTS